MIGKTIRDLKIISEIGVGGMGVVYLAEHLHLGKQFAVKCLSSELTRRPEARERFANEARAQARLDHPNIVQIADYFEIDKHCYLVMEYVKGDGLDDLIAVRNGLPEKECLRILKDMLTGLNYAHSKGIIHRDIKPSNIMIDKQGTVKITDFGIALMVGMARKTKTGVNMGTVWYMSPEQIEHPKQIDHRSDVYSMGVILYEMLSGKVPFDGDTDFEIYKKHLQQHPPPLNSVTVTISPILEKIVLKALEKKPDDRFAGCGEFLVYIESFEAYKKEERRENRAVENALQWEEELNLLFEYEADESKKLISQEPHMREKIACLKVIKQNKIEEDPTKAVAKSKTYWQKINLFLALLLFIIFSCFAYFYYANNSTDENEPCNRIKARIDHHKGYYVRRYDDSLLFVIEGNIVHKYEYPRSYFRVKGKLISKNKRFLHEQEVYAGSLLKKAELASFSQEKIELELSNVKGIEKQNTRVKTNQKLPFMIVFFNLTNPEALDQYSVEVICSY